eukprot:gene10653-10812_t
MVPKARPGPALFLAWSVVDATQDLAQQVATALVVTTAPARAAAQPSPAHPNLQELSSAELFPLTSVFAPLDTEAPCVLNVPKAPTALEDP